MAKWAGMCLVGVNAHTADRLDMIVADGTRSRVPVCRGAALWLRQNFGQALVELEQAITQHQDSWDLPFWYSLTYASLGRNEDAVAALERALGLPPVLLAPLRWLERDKADFYEQYAKPILARYG